MTSPGQVPATFKDENRALQELARELALLRGHNLKFKEGDPQHTLLMFAEAAVVCMTMEHFVRIVLGSSAPADATLFNLLQMAVSRGLIKVPWNDQEEGIKKIVAVRNSLLHGNYAQAARGAGCGSVADYFRTQFAGEVEAMTKITDLHHEADRPGDREVVLRVGCGQGRRPCSRAARKHTTGPPPAEPPDPSRIVPPWWG